MTRFSGPDTCVEPEEATQRFGRYLDGGDPDVRRAAHSMNDDERAGFAGGEVSEQAQQISVLRH